MSQIIKEDKALIYEDWKECILPLMASAPFELNPDFFGIEHYFAAKSLIASRSFEIDNYHGCGMVPLADLFNHKTGAEDIHFTLVASHFESDNDADDDRKDENDNPGDDDPMVLEMIIVKDVKAGAEVFNTYGSVGNAALLHRYGFTEPDNPYDILNIDLELVLQWSLSLFSSRYSRRRLSLWRRLDYSGCISQKSEYFEISFDGEPQVELLTLIYIMLLPEKASDELDLTLSTMGNSNIAASAILSNKGNNALGKCSEMNKTSLLTKGVCCAILSLADIRESFYGSNSLEDDIEGLNRCCPTKERKLYHSLMLRVSERKILKKLRTYASARPGIFRTAKRATVRKKLKTA